MTYKPREHDGRRLGLYADKIEKRRRELGLDERGFPLSRPSPAKDEDCPKDN
jgi:hypothetical protein